MWFLNKMDFFAEKVIFGHRIEVRIRVFIWNIKRMKYYSVSFLYVNVEELTEFLFTCF